MCAILAPQTKEPAPASTRPTARDLRTLVREQRRDDLGANLPCPWRQRGKAARGWAAAAHFGCCVLWLCFVLWLVARDLGTYVGVGFFVRESKRFMVEQNLILEHSHISFVFVYHKRKFCDL